MTKDPKATRVVAASLATALLASVPAVGASAQTSSGEPRLVAHEIMWVQIRTAEGVYGEAYDLPPRFAEASEGADAVEGDEAQGDASGGGSFTFARLDDDGDGGIQEEEWLTAATGSGMEEELSAAHFDVIDEDGDGTLDESEFQAITGNHFVQALAQGGIEGRTSDLSDTVTVPVVVYRLSTS